MRFTLLDRIVDLQPGATITAVKSLSLGEEYLKDHFPLFPVMPGVLMIEAMTQAGAWLIRAGEDFAHSIVVLKEARNVRYADFVEPGQVLTVTASILDSNERDTRMKVQGTVNGNTSVSARLTLTRYNLADENPQLAGADARVRRNLRQLFAQLYRPEETPLGNVGATAATENGAASESAAHQLGG